MDTDTEVVVRDVGLQSSRSLSDGLVGFALPPGGCTVISNGRYTNYLTSYRQGTEGELDCLPSCSGVSRAVVTQGYRILLCVAAAEARAESLVFEAGECKGDKVVQFDKRGCQAESDCRTSGYKVDLGACVVKTWDECTTGEQGFHAGKCVAMPRDARQCQAVGKVLQFDTEGCEIASVCEGAGYKVVSNACVVKTWDECTTGEQGFANGKCVASPRDPKQCQAVGKVLQLDTEGCEARGACEGEGYKVVSDACVVKTWDECTTGEQGFANGKCVASPRDPKHCQAVGKVLQLDTEGCEKRGACEGEGYKVVSNACVVKEESDCRSGEQGFANGKCVASPRDPKQCQAVGKVLQLDTEGCEARGACEGEGYKVVSDACVVKVGRVHHWRARICQWQVCSVSARPKAVPSCWQSVAA